MVDRRSLRGEEQLFYSWSRHSQNDQCPARPGDFPQGTTAGEALSRRSDHPTSDLALAQPSTRVQGWPGYACTCRRAALWVVMVVVVWCGVVRLQVGRGRVMRGAETKTDRVPGCLEKFSRQPDTHPLLPLGSTGGVQEDRWAAHSLPPDKLSLPDCPAAMPD